MKSVDKEAPFYYIYGRDIVFYKDIKKKVMTKRSMDYRLQERETHWLKGFFK